MKVEFSPQADAEVDEGLEWWLGHRDKAPGLFARELKQAVRRIARIPNAGLLVETPGLSFQVLYVAMKKTRFRLFYRIRREQHVVEVLRLWHMSRGEDPTF